MNKVRNERGALTLIESVIVLMLISMLLLIPTITFQPYQDKIEIDLFIEEVNNNITLMQNHAVFNGQPTEIRVLAEANQIQFYVQGQDHHPLNSIVYPPEQVTILSTRRYRFKAQSGNIGRLGRARFQTDEGIYEFVFQLGSGRFYVQKV